MSDITKELARMAEAVKSASAHAVGRMAEKIVVKMASTPTKGAEAEQEGMAKCRASARDGAANTQDEAEQKRMAEEMDGFNSASARDEFERGRMAGEIAGFRSASTQDKAERGRMAEEIAALRSKALLWHHQMQ